MVFFIDVSSRVARYNFAQRNKNYDDLCIAGSSKTV
jgi:hypothetical protein